MFFREILQKMEPLPNNHLLSMHVIYYAELSDLWFVELFVLMWNGLFLLSPFLKNMYLYWDIIHIPCNSLI